ncbi:unnamed protein product [Linum trigynum]|uniref:Uncharacterized protein n=1 Tax=Linum trigynum TaxID=586398 RepID=A0AAV2E7W8_9ROSI
MFRKNRLETASPLPFALPLLSTCSGRHSFAATPICSISYYTAAVVDDCPTESKILAAFSIVTVETRSINLLNSRNCQRDLVVAKDGDWEMGLAFELGDGDWIVRMSLGLGLKRGRHI